ncbi:MAG: cbb3-type cytochrome c oxidase subunit I [Desulfobacteraceae bacterium]|nr:cbb3-type cytochrome c oxidase subunit I [Desulfobacteraceae bacterium]
MDSQEQTLSRWWRIGVVATVLIGFTILILLSSRAYNDSPPIPDTIVNAAGQTVLTGEEIRAGQRVFLRYGLMENGTIWGHGAYLGPDFSAQYLHTLALAAADSLARKTYGSTLETLDAIKKEALSAEVQRLLKQNRYDPQSKTLLFTEPEEASYHEQIGLWSRHFSQPSINGGLPAKYITNPTELAQLTAFFAWSAWAAVVNRPGLDYSYTSNFPYEPLVGNRPTQAALLWSALSLIALLGATAFVLFIFGKFSYLGWKTDAQTLQAIMVPGQASPGQRATLKYFVIVALLFLAQVLVGGAMAHNRAEPGTFYGFDLYALLPTTVLRTWHLQLAIFWVATSFIAGGLVLAAAMGQREPKGQTQGIHLLFWALFVLVAGSLFGELLGVRQMLGSLWSWLGHQGWEYLDLGRAWQVILVVGLVVWMVLLVRFVKPAYQNRSHRELAVLFTIAAGVIPVFYLPAFFFGSNTNFTVVDTWRFWIIHLWVEGFFELFVTTMVAVTFFQLGLVSRITATRIIYLDAILFLGSGVVGTGHHWYWTGQSHLNMALSAIFSAMEVVPLTLLTLDAWDFIKLTRGDENGSKPPKALAHKWTFYFLMAVGFWNFVGAGIFGFLINLPIVSYYEIGTVLTPNHGHAAMMGVFGMEAVALMVLGFRQALSDAQWVTPEKYIRVSFWGLNIGLLLMILGNLFPGGVLQLYDVLKNGYWHARSAAYLDQGFVRAIEWARLPGDVVFICLGVIPLVIAALITYKNARRPTEAQSSTRVAT